MTSTSDELLYHCPECGAVGSPNSRLRGTCGDDMITHFYKDGDYVEEECYESKFDDDARLSFYCANCGHWILKDVNTHYAVDEMRKILEVKELELTRLLKFHCPKCGGNELECVQTGADVTQTIQADATSGEVYYTGVPEISGDYTEIDRFQCHKCGYTIPHVNNEYEIVDWLKRQPCNRKLTRRPEEQEEIRQALKEVCDAYKVYMDDKLSNVVSGVVAFNAARDRLLGLIGGMEDKTKTEKNK